jgi:hypothetical protein
MGKFMQRAPNDAGDRFGVARRHRPAGMSQTGASRLALVAIYGGILRLASALHTMIPKSGDWIFEKIVLKQQDEIEVRVDLNRS